MSTERAAPLIAGVRKFDELFSRFAYRHDNDVRGVDWQGRDVITGDRATSKIGPSIHWTDANDVYTYGRAVPSQEVVDAVRANMLCIKYDSIYFVLHLDDDGTARVYAQYNQIIGNRLLAVVDASTIPASDCDE